MGLDIGNLQLKSAHIMNTIDGLLENNDDANKIEIIKKIIEKLKKYRQTGLEREGELSYENLVYKILRNYGYFDKLHQIKNDLLAKKLTLEQKRIS